LADDGVAGAPFIGADHKGFELSAAGLDSGDDF
jgi:hypothetical protein